MPVTGRPMRSAISRVESGRFAVNCVRISKRNGEVSACRCASPRMRWTGLTFAFAGREGLVPGERLRLAMGED